MKYVLVIFCFIYSFSFSQENQFYFIGEKIKEEHCPWSITVTTPAKRYDCIPGEMDDDCYPEISMPECLGGSGEYFSTYKIIKVIKGIYEKETVDFSSVYCSEFGYSEAPNSRYVIIGLIKQDEKWWQSYIEKIYLAKDNKWILPYKENYPFIDYKNVFPQRLKRSQRIKINMYDPNNNVGILSLVYNQPFYKRSKKNAIAIYGFIF